MIMGNQMIDVTNNMILVVSKKTKKHTIFDSIVAALLEIEQML